MSDFCITSEVPFFGALVVAAQNDVSTWDMPHIKECLKGVERAMESDLANDEDFHREANVVIEEIDKKASDGLAANPQSEKELKDILEITKRIIDNIKEMFARIAERLGIGGNEASNTNRPKGP